MSGTILDILARPRPVTLGGRTFLVDEFRLEDLADLQSWLRRRWTDPMDGLRDRLGSMAEDERRAALRGAYDVAEEGPPTWGDDRGRDLLDSAEGILETFRLALRRHHPEMTMEDDVDAMGMAVAEGILSVAMRTTPAEYWAMRRVLWGVGPLDEIEAAMGVERNTEGGIPWTQAVCELAEAYPGWTVGDIGSLTLTEVRTVREGGRPVVRGMPAMPGADLKQMVRDARKKFQGPEKGAV
jgi:hypothetical protein